MSTCVELLKDISADPISLPDFKARFTILDVLGKGAFATVYRVVDNTNNTVVALKDLGILKEALNQNEIKVGCLLEATKVYTDSIVSIIHWVRLTDNTLFYTLPILQEPIYEYAKRNPFTPEVERAVVFELIIAIYAMYQAGIVHYDLVTVSNIMMQPTDKVRCYTINGVAHFIDLPAMPVIIDFGRSIIIEEQIEKLRQQAADPTISYGPRTEDAIQSYIESIRGFDWGSIDLLLGKLWIRSRIIDQTSLSTEDLGKIHQRDGSVLLSPTFSMFRDRPIQGTDTIKYFEPIVI